MSITSSEVAALLEKTVNAVVVDPSFGSGDSEVNRYYEISPSKKAFETDEEYAGIGLASMVGEGAEIPTAAIKHGSTMRYDHDKWGIRMVVTDEAIEDNMYMEAIDETKNLSRSMWKTVDYDGIQIFVHGWDTAVTYGDGKPLFSTSHPLPKGGMGSNTLATPMAPSTASLTVIGTAIARQVSHDGLIQGYKTKKVVAPYDQWGVWRVLTGSARDPGAGEFNAVNIVKDLSLEPVMSIYWTNTATNWAIMTDCKKGLRWFWRRRPRTKTWMDNAHENVHSSITARWSRGVTDWRCAFGSQF